MRWLAMLGFATVATVTAAGAVTGTARADTALPGPPRCAVSYTPTSEWYGEYSAQISLIYDGFPAELGWQLSFDFVSPGQRIVSFPGEQWYQSGEHVIVTNPSQATPGDGSLQLGFIGSSSDVNPPPVNFTFDGVACTTGAIVTLSGVPPQASSGHHALD